MVYLNYFASVNKICFKNLTRSAIKGQNVKPFKQLVHMVKINECVNLPWHVNANVLSIHMVLNPRVNLHNIHID